MNTPLEQLYRLQDRLRFVSAREKERDTIPAELTEVDREYREKVDAVDRLKQRLSDAEGERRRIEIGAVCRIVSASSAGITPISAI